MNAFKLHSFRQPLHKKIINTREHGTVCGFHTGDNKKSRLPACDKFCIILSRFVETMSFASIVTAEERE